MTIKLPLSSEAYIKAMVIGLEVANAGLLSSLCVDPMLIVVATLVIFSATLDSNFIALKDKEQVTEAGNYLAKQLATMAKLVDKSLPIVVAPYDAISRGKGGRWRETEKTLLFDTTCGFTHSILLTNLVELDGDICLYLAILMVAALVWSGEALVMQEGMQITTMTREAFKYILMNETSHNYDNYGLIRR